MRPTLLAIAIAALAAAPAWATVLGRMSMDIGGRHVAYRITDASNAGSGWEARPGGKMLSILWQGPKATDLLLMEMLVKDGRAVSGRILLPEAQDGTLEAKMPTTLSVHLGQARSDGTWLKIRGRLTGTFYPQRRNGQLLPDDALKVSAHFDSWIPGITAAAPKPAAKSPARRDKGATGAARRPPRLRPDPAKPKQRP